jgi:hypothetical protein
MLKLLGLAILAVLAISLTANPAKAGGYWAMHPWMPCYYVHYEPQKATAWCPEKHFREVEVVVQEPTYKTVTKRFKKTVLVEEFRNEEHTGTFSRSVPRSYEIEVLRVRLVPMKVASPCGHCVFTVGYPELYWQKMEQIAMERVVEQRTWTVRVPYYRPVEKLYEQDVVEVEWHAKTVKVLEPYTILVPYEISLYVPILVPPAVPCCP